jgi:hypothetical protein
VSCNWGDLGGIFSNKNIIMGGVQNPFLTINMLLRGVILGGVACVGVVGTKINLGKELQLVRI